MRAQSVSPGRARPGVAGGDRGLQRVGAARPAERLGARERGEPAAHQQPVPARAVLVEQQHRLAGGPRRAPERDAWISISATRPCTSGSVGSELGEDAPEPQRLLAQRRSHPVVAGGRRVALVEDEVDDLEHRGQPRGSSSPRGTSNGTRASARVRLARTIRWATVGSGTRKARAISSVVSPPSRRSVSATRASVDSTGWQAMKMSRSRSSPTSSSSSASRSGRPWRSAGLELARQLARACARAAAAPAEQVDRAVLRGGHQPGARVVRDA